MNRIEITATITAETSYSDADLQAHAQAELANVLRGNRDGVTVIGVTVTGVQAVAVPAVDLGTLSNAEKEAAEAAVRALRS
jgi:hypothetical protein